MPHAHQVRGKMKLPKTAHLAAAFVTLYLLSLLLYAPIPLLVFLGSGPTLNPGEQTPLFARLLGYFDTYR